MAPTKPGSLHAEVAAPTVRQLHTRLVWLIAIRMLVVGSVAMPYLLYNPDKVTDPTLQLFIAFVTFGPDPALHYSATGCFVSGP